MAALQIDEEAESTTYSISSPLISPTGAHDADRPVVE